MSVPAGGYVTLAEAASTIITNFEGDRLSAYQDVGGVWTVGHGHTGSVDGKPVAAGMTITQAQAEALLAEDESVLFKLVAGRPLLEAAALVSFGYNCGIGALETVLAGHATLTTYDHVHGQAVAGLTRRRQFEETMILISMQMSRK